ncbi:MAG: modification methylase, partial [Candidatus Marinimicrobia bacterium]|nr:modification methylase [Candidatus Neomarinimicrobiota bacterium]
EGMIRVSGVHWFTNLEINKRHEDLILYKNYTPEEYPKYDNYDAIEVSKTKDIPLDFPVAMGVPITFMDKYNPIQFEIIGNDTDIKDGHLPELVNQNWTGKLDRGYINGKRIYSRIFIKNKRI